MVVGIREGSLWLVDARGQPFVVPVNHPGLKARCLAAQGDSQAAKLLAERGMLHASWSIRTHALLTPKCALSRYQPCLEESLAERQRCD